MLTDKELLENALESQRIYDLTPYYMGDRVMRICDHIVPVNFDTRFIKGHMMAQLEMEKQKNDMEHL